MTAPFSRNIPLAFALVFFLVAWIAYQAGGAFTGWLIGGLFAHAAAQLRIYRDSQ